MRMYVLRRKNAGGNMMQNSSNHNGNIGRAYGQTNNETEAYIRILSTTGTIIQDVSSMS